MRWVVEHRTLTGHKPVRVDLPVIHNSAHLPDIAIALTLLQEDKVGRSDEDMLAELAFGVDNRLTLQFIVHRDKALCNGLLIYLHRLFNTTLFS